MKRLRPYLRVVEIRHSARILARHADNLLFNGSRSELERRKERYGRGEEVACMDGTDSRVLTLAAAASRCCRVDRCRCRVA
ncbi:hypothetical protein THAOC_22161 [Thalassiosira oceanica]|uniref:Uncharacterized protein n=1 Tax=Thalassiosira oceanica TaxID=159749 RepID=K0RZ87_THAOC|nr:hypothetical protein THAOC_22161 [Thalassiosira oceanica]|eukprot:EJK57764.1 hypothetical protein THAOC_22161 [Thalassiosira oceanica]